MLQLYSNIKLRRLELKMTQSELAHKMGYADKSMIAKIEKGTVDLTQSKIITFAEVLKTTPEMLMGVGNTSSVDSSDYMILSPIEKTIISVYRNADTLDKELIHRILNIDNIK